MGTSTANSGTSGSGTPLIPSWLDSPESVDGAGGDSPSDQGKGDDSSPIPQPGDSKRYTAARTAFSKFARSGGSSRSSLKSAVSSYISRSSGGVKGAAHRMGASRATGDRLLGILNDVTHRGIIEVLKSFNLEDLAGRSASEIFKGLADNICPEGGNIDLAIARDAFYRTIVDLEAEGITSLDDLNSDQVQTIFEMFTTRSIEDRIYNEIGAKAITLPADTAAIDNVQAQVHDFISNAVADATNSMKDRLNNLPQDKVREFVDDLYEKAFTVLQAMTESEGEN